MSYQVACCGSQPAAGVGPPKELAHCKSWRIGPPQELARCKSWPHKSWPVARVCPLHKLACCKGRPTARCGPLQELAHQELARCKSWLAARVGPPQELARCKDQHRKSLHAERVGPLQEFILLQELARLNCSTTFIQQLYSCQIIYGCQLQSRSRLYALLEKPKSGKKSCTLNSEIMYVEQWQQNKRQFKFCRFMLLTIHPVMHNTKEASVGQQ